jgi:hypothetical protein
MEVYEIEDPSTGLVIEVEGDAPPTNDDAIQIFEKYKEMGQIGLSSGSYRHDPRNGMRLDNEQSRERFQELFAQSLGLPFDSVDIENGLPALDRAALDFLPTMSDKAQALSKKFGRENVSIVSIDSEPRLTYRDPKTNKVRLVDEMGLSWADVTSDIAGEVLPTAATIGAGMATIGSGGVLAPAVAAGAAWFGTGGAQDIAARLLAGDDLDLVEIAKRRGFETALQVPLDMATMKAGGWLVGLIGKKGQDVATAEVMSLIQDEIKAPQAMLRGEASQAKVSDLITQFPESKLAYRVQTEKEKMADKLLRITNGDKKQFVEKFDTLTRELKDEQRVLEEAVASAAEKKTVASRAIGEAKQATSAERASAKAEARKLFEADLQNKVDNLGARSDFSPEATGQEVQKRVLRRFLQTELQSNKLYDVAKQSMRGVNTTFDEFGKVLSQSSRNLDVLRDIEGEIIETMAPATAIKTEKTIDRIADLGAEPMTFAQMNEALQMVRSRVPYGSKGLIQSGASAEQRAAYQVAKSLEGLRDKMLNRASPQARQAFVDAENFYKQRVLPYNETDLNAILKLEEGQNLRSVMEQVRAGKMPTRVTMSLGGTEVLQKALINPKAVSDILRSTGNSSIVRNQLRQAWLHKKGLHPNTPLDKFSFTKSDMDMANALWDKRKVKALQEIQAFSRGKDIAVDGLSEKLFAGLETAKTDVAITNWKKSVKEYAKHVKALKDFNANKLMKGIANGDFPAPRSSQWDDDFAKAFLDRSFSNKEIREFVNRLGDRSGGFQNSVFSALIARAGGGQYPIDSAQIRKMGQALWDVDEMAKLLKTHDRKIRQLVGDSKHRAIVRLNNGMRRFKAKRPAVTPQKDKPRANVATSLAGGISFFLTGIPQYAYNRVLSALWGSDILSKLLIRPIGNQKELDEAMAIAMKALFTTRRGWESLMLEAEKDPEFFNWLNDQMNYGRPKQQEAPAN